MTEKKYEIRLRLELVPQPTPTRPIRVNGIDYLPIRPLVVNGIHYKPKWVGRSSDDDEIEMEMVASGKSKLEECVHMDRRTPKKVCVEYNSNGEIKAEPIW